MSQCCVTVVALNSHAFIRFSVSERFVFPPCTSPEANLPVHASTRKCNLWKSWAVSVSSLTFLTRRRLDTKAAAGVPFVNRHFSVGPEVYSECIGWN